MTIQENPAGIIPANELARPQFCTGFGQYDTHAETLSSGKRNTAPTAGTDYQGITGKEIAKMAANPPSLPKGEAQWFIPSTYRASDGREHDVQRNSGEFWFLPLDVDCNDLSLKEIDEAVAGVCGDVGRIIYSSRSAKPDDRKWRALVPLKEPLSGDDYGDTVGAFNDMLTEASVGLLIPDRAFERAGQLIYLPNKGEFYEHEINKGNRLDLTPDHPTIQRREDTRRKRAEAERLARASCERRRQKALADPEGSASVIEAFNASTTVAAELERYGYEAARGGRDWRSPNSTTGSYAVRDYGDFWISLSGSDADQEIGNTSPSGARIGDAFDLFCHYEHDGNNSAAIKDAAQALQMDHASRRRNASTGMDPSKFWQLSDGTDARSEASPDGGNQEKIEAGQPSLPLQASAAFCAARTPADYLIDGSLRDGWLYTLTAPTGHGKSAVALAMAYAIARGGYLGSNEIKQGSVLFLAGENADDIRERWIASCEVNGDDPATLPVTFMPGVWDLKGSLPLLREYFEQNPLRLVIVDTLAAFFDGDNENDNAQQQEFATRVLRPLTELPGRPAVLVPAHPTKGAGKDALTPKGGSSLLNAVDGNLSAWNTDGTIKVHWQGKFRGAPWKPMFFELNEHHSEQLTDSRGRIMPTVTARAMLDSEIGEATEQGVKVENQVLKLLNDGLSIRDIAADVVADGQRGISKGRVERVVQRLAEQKWIAKQGRKWALTTQGMEVLKQASEGFDPDV